MHRRFECFCIDTAALLLVSVGTPNPRDLYRLNNTKNVAKFKGSAIQAIHIPHKQTNADRHGIPMIVAFEFDDQVV